jgi:hypothetical protein
MIMKSFPMSKTSVFLSQTSLVLLTPLAAVERLEGSRSSEVPETELADPCEPGFWQRQISGRTRKLLVLTPVQPYSMEV